MLQAVRRVVRRSADGDASDDAIAMECYSVLGRERDQFFDERQAFYREVKDILATLVRKVRIHEHATIPGVYLLPE